MEVDSKVIVMRLIQKWMKNDSVLFTVKNIYPHVNKVTHKLTWVAKDFSSPYCWVEPPDFLKGLVDISCPC